MKIAIILFVTHKVVLIYSPQTFKPGPKTKKGPEKQKKLECEK